MSLLCDSYSYWENFRLGYCAGWESVVGVSKAKAVADTESEPESSEMSLGPLGESQDMERAMREVLWRPPVEEPAKRPKLHDFKEVMDLH